MNDNSLLFCTGEQLLSAWGCNSREERLERSCMALMEQLDHVHNDSGNGSLKASLENQHVYCSCMDACRMGHASLKK